MSTFLIRQPILHRPQHAMEVARTSASLPGSAPNAPNRWHVMCLTCGKSQYRCVTHLSDSKATRAAGFAAAAFTLSVRLKPSCHNTRGESLCPRLSTLLCMPAGLPCAADHWLRLWVPALPCWRGAHVGPPGPSTLQAFSRCPARGWSSLRWSGLRPLSFELPWGSCRPLVLAQPQAYVQA